MHKTMIVAVALLGLPVGAPAQQDPGCTYATCALRVESSSGFFPSSKVVRGWPGQEVADADRSPELEALLTEVDSAGAFYFRFAEQDRRADRWNLVGALAFAGGYLLTNHGRNDTAKVIGAGIAVGGSVMGILSTRMAQRARSDLERSIWLYNAALAGGTGAPRFEGAR